AADVRVAHFSAAWEGNLLLSIVGSDDDIALWGFDENDQVRFADGTIWSQAALQAMALPAVGGAIFPNGADELVGTDGWDRFGLPENGGITMRGLAGNDEFYGGDGNDIIEGGAGDDYLGGGWGVDEYRFSQGFGQDRIDDESDFSRIVFD